MNELYCIALYSIPRLAVDYQDLRKIWWKCLYFSKLLIKGYVSKVALSRSIDGKQPLTCLFSGEGFLFLHRWLCEGTQAWECVSHRWNVKLWLCNDYHSLFSHWCKWCTNFQWMKARYLQEKKLLLIIYCFRNGKKHIVVLLWLLHVFYLFPNGNCFSDLKLTFTIISKWCTLWECLLCAVTCCRILCMESVKASKHVTGIL